MTEFPESPAHARSCVALSAFRTARAAATQRGASRVVRPTPVASGPILSGWCGRVFRSCAWLALVIGSTATVDAAVIDDFMITSSTAAIPYHVANTSGTSSASASTSLVGDYIFDTRSLAITDTSFGSPYTFFNSNSFSFPNGPGMARIDQGLTATVAGQGTQSMVVTYSNFDGHVVDLSGVDSFQLTRSNPFSSGGGPDWGGSGTWLRLSVLTASGEYIAPLESTLSTEFIGGVADLGLTDFYKLGGNSIFGPFLTRAALGSVSAVRLLQSSSASAGPLSSGSGYRTIDLTGIRAVPEPIIGPSPVPEIDAVGTAPACALLAGVLGLLDRRRRIA